MGTRVYIGRLPYQAREKDVERFFRGYGRINDIMLKNGYGFVVSIGVYIYIYTLRIYLKGKSTFLNCKAGVELGGGGEGIPALIDFGI